MRFPPVFRAHCSARVLVLVLILSLVLLAGAYPAHKQAAGDSSLAPPTWGKLSSTGGPPAATRQFGTTKLVDPNALPDPVRSNLNDLWVLTNSNDLGGPPAPTQTMQLSLTNYNVNKVDGHATITVLRTGDTSSSATVDYRTTDTDTFTLNCADPAKHGSAYARCDYATTLGTLSFAAGESSKTFPIPIIADSYADGNETFSVVLSNPTGASLGTPATSTVTIINNDTVNGPNPILLSNDAGISFFVRQHYLDFLAREPEVGEPWSAILRGCGNQFNTDPGSASAGCDRITVSGDFFGSPEFKDKGIYVIDFYRVAFSRLPQYAEFVQDLASVTGATAAETFAKRATFANNFVLRPEFVNAYGGMNNSTYVMTLMGHYSLNSITTPDPANPDGGTKVTLTTSDLINGLNTSSLTRAQVLRAIVQSDQVSLNFEAINAFVASQYYGYLRRTPDTAGFNSWVNYLNAHPTDFRTMVNGFVNSTEYRLRFGPTSFTLAVTKAGTGSGTVTSLPLGINCGATCSASYATGTSATLTATAGVRSVFAGWIGGGCSGTGNCTLNLLSNAAVTAVFVTSGTIETATKLITASQGGTITLPSGNSVLIPAGALPNDQTVTLSLLPSLPDQPPSGLIASVGPALSLSFAPTMPTGTLETWGVRSYDQTYSASSMPIQLHIDFSKSSASGFDGSEPLGEFIVPKSGSQERVFVGLNGQVDLTTKSATVSVDPSVIQSNTTFHAALSNVSQQQPSVCPGPTFGPKYWDGSKFQNYLSLNSCPHPFPLPPGFNPTKKTLIFVHGMLSTVEHAFGDSCPGGSGAAAAARIGSVGGYDQVLGFDYDWTQGINQSGQQLAQFLECLRANGFSNVDIEAHSEGVPVALSAASQSSLPIGNMALLGGPIMGTPVASPGARLQTVLSYLPAGSYCLGNVRLADFFNGQFATDLQSNSDVLAGIRSAFNLRIQHPNVITVAGNLSFDVTEVDGLENILQVQIQLPFDGIIPESSALGVGSGLIGLHQPQLAPYPLNHTQLECDLNVIIDVANALVKPSPTPSPSPSPSPPSPSPSPTPTPTPLTGTWTGTWAWSGPGANGCTFNDGGAFSMILTQGGNSFSGSTSGAGIQTRDANAGCALTSTDSGTGTASGTISGTTLNLSFTLGGAINTLSFTGTGTLNNNTITASFVRSTGGSGSFTVTRNPGGVSGFLDNQLEAANLASIANFMARPAFAHTYNSLSNQQYADSLLNTAGVTLAPATRQSMTDGLNNSTMTRGAGLKTDCREF